LCVTPPLEPTDPDAVRCCKGGFSPAWSDEALDSSGGAEVAEGSGVVVLSKDDDAGAPKRAATSSFVDDAVALPDVPVEGAGEDLRTGATFTPGAEGGAPKRSAVPPLTPTALLGCTGGALPKISEAVASLDGTVFFGAGEAEVEEEKKEEAPSPVGKDPIVPPPPPPNRAEAESKELNAPLLVRIPVGFRGVGAGGKLVEEGNERD
jgi:hypothetical protein